VARETKVPGLAILEAPMGEGKTEAAFYFADYWNATGFRGSYIAMPTQATSNQLFERFRRFLQARYDDAERINLQLLHGHAALSTDLKLLMTDQWIPQPTGVDSGDDEAGEASVGAAEWFTYRKRGLLAPFGVGTIDQALLSVLQVKHGFVRLFGLAGKTIIIDEVHAYDTYMSTLLERLLEWLAALGSPVVLLSATLPSARRKGLVSAYTRGLGHSVPAQPGPLEKYPRITLVDSSGVRESHVEASPETRRALGIRWLAGGVGGLPEMLLAALDGGGCAAVVCNTVARAQEIYVALRDEISGCPEAQRPQLDLFHARFLFKDRQEREERCLRRFGKPNQPDGTTADRPRRAILVATQVIEQSLDLDFDLMVSELAPVDLLLQRAGRLHRHQRSDRRGPQTPTLHILRPELEEGLPKLEGGATFVYDEHILLRSWHTLKDRESANIPDDVEELIETVYRESGKAPAGDTEALTDRWVFTFEAMEENRKSRQALASQPLIPSSSSDEEEFLELPNAGLLEDRPDAARERRARTRYEDLPSVRVIWLDAEEVVDAEVGKGAKERVRGLLMNSVELRGNWAPSLYRDELLPPSWRVNAVLRHFRLLVITDNQYLVPGGPMLICDPELGIAVQFSSQSREAVDAD
jgi:CRISPR-associated endonuclease/helicase Cas3